LPAITHRRRGIDDDPQRAIRLRLELTNEQVIVPQQRAHIEVPEIIARRVRAMPAELDARTLACAAMRAGPYALGDHARANTKGRETPPIDRTPEIARFAGHLGVRAGRRRGRGRRCSPSPPRAARARGRAPSGRVPMS